MKSTHKYEPVPSLAGLTSREEERHRVQEAISHFSVRRHQMTQRFPDTWGRVD